MENEKTPRFPPLLHGVEVPAHVDPLSKALIDAARAAEPGQITFSRDFSTMRAAMTFVPDRVLQQALPGAVFAVLLGVNDALGALAPPEVAVHFEWPGRIKVNGAYCGDIRAVAETTDPAGEPEWLIVAVDLAIMPPGDTDPGLTPDDTNLWAEGCVELGAPQLIESWSRHMLVWINRFLDDGLAPLHAAWRQKCDTLGEEITTPAFGTFMGLDQEGGMILRNGKETRVLSLTTLLEAET